MPLSPMNYVLTPSIIGSVTDYGGNMGNEGIVPIVVIEQKKAIYIYIFYFLLNLETGGRKDSLSHNRSLV